MEILGIEVIDEDSDTWRGYSKDDCLDALSDLQRNNPDKSISRDFYCKETGIDKRIIDYFFGTFTEFKRVSGLSPTRKENKFKTIRAKEVAAETVRNANERWEWNKIFPVRDDSHRFKQFVVISDVHDEMCDPFYRRMVLQAIEDVRPAKVIINGDLFDNAEISKYGKRLSDYNPVRKMKWVHNFLADIRQIVPDAEIILVEGNHEYRLVAHLTEKSSYVMDMLGANGIGVREFLGLDKFDVNYYARADLGTFSERDIKNELMRNYYKFEDKVLFHHFPQGMKFGMPGAHGHHHKYYAKDCFNATYGNYQWIQSGGGVRRHVDYTVTMGEMWDNGFIVATIDTESKHNTILEYVDATKEFCRLHGQMYKRTEEEKIFLVQ